MLQFIIDGYNLVHKINKVKESFFPCQELLAFIYRNKFTGSKNNQVCIVFDGRRPSYDIPDFYYKVLFSNEKSADDLIVELVKKAKNKKQVLVVTDDRELAYKVKLWGAKVTSVDQFTSKKERSHEKTTKKDIKYSDQHQITEELRKIWLDEDEES